MADRITGATTVTSARSGHPGRVGHALCVLPPSEVPVRIAVMMALTDVVVHGWGVARGLGRACGVGADGYVGRHDPRRAGHC